MPSHDWTVTFLFAFCEASSPACTEAFAGKKSTLALAAIELFDAYPEKIPRCAAARRLLFL